MGKGDGKKKRKKKATSTPQSTPSTPTTQPPPPRVSTDINVPVRRQLLWARHNKAARAASAPAFRQKNNVKRTAYRRSLSEEELEEAATERTRLGQEPDWDVVLNATATRPLVIVDAYNIIYKWPRLKKWMNRGMLSRARETLVHDMEELRLVKGWRIEVVFDGYGRNVNGVMGDGPGGIGRNDKISRLDREASREVTDHGVRVVYSGAGTSADGYIEKRCFEAKSVTGGTMTGSLIVASDDNMIRTAASSSGALCMSAERMVDELKVVRKATKYRVEAALAVVNGENVRPIQIASGSNGEKIMLNRFTRGSAVIKDNRNRVKKKKVGTGAKTLEDLKKGTTEIPDWALTPEQKERIKSEQAAAALTDGIDDDSASTQPDL